jgi:hypothetical protein
MSLITLIQEVPESLLTQSVNEINSVDWENSDDSEMIIEKDFRRTALILREIYNIPDCESIEQYDQFAHDLIIDGNLENIQSLIDWAKTATSSTYVGKALVVLLDPEAIVDDHINDSNYFSYYNRYHIPLVTHTDAKFVDSASGIEEHMEVGKLYKLSNNIMHRALNNSSITRIHLIIDMA